MKGEDMAYTPMTAEQYVVAELQDAKDHIIGLSQTIASLEEKLNEANSVLNELCKKMRINESEYIGEFITLDISPSETSYPELFAELKRRIVTHEV